MTKKVLTPFEKIVIGAAIQHELGKTTVIQAKQNR
jgi:hypothetical protein